MEKHYLTWPFDTYALSERGYGFAVRSNAIQFDVTGKACVLVVTADGFGDLYRDVEAGRGYLIAVPVTVIGELEPGVAVIRSNRLRNRTWVFAPAEIKPLGPDYAKRYFHGEVGDEPPTVD